MQKITSAFVYVGSFGYHELYVNGQKVTDNVMNPVSSYMKKRIPYLTYDIANTLKKEKMLLPFGMLQDGLDGIVLQNIEIHHLYLKHKPKL